MMNAGWNWSRNVDLVDFRTANGAYKTGFLLANFVIMSGSCAKSVWGSGSCRSCYTKTGSCPDPILGNRTVCFWCRFYIHSINLPGDAGYPYRDPRIGRDGCDPKYSACPAAALLGDLFGVAKFFLVTGCTDMRKRIDGWQLSGYLWNGFRQWFPVPFFCGRCCDRIKALHFEKDGFCLLYKRLDNGHFQWPRNPAEVRNLTR